jgi:glucokinase
LREATEGIGLGIDIGGSKVALGLVDHAGALIHTERILAEPWTGLLPRVRASAARLVERASQLDLDLAGVGIGVPQLVDVSGEVVSDQGDGWSSTALRESLAFAGPVWIEADVRAAAVAEAIVGAGVGAEDWPYVNLGTGVSHCMVSGGRPVPGSHGRAILSGSTTMTVLDPVTARLVRGRVEDVASGRGLVERYRLATGQAIDARHIIDAAAHGDATAITLRNDLIELVGSALANLIDVLDPSLIVIGGGLATIPIVFDGVAAAARSAIWFDGGRDLPIVQAALGPDSGVVGAGLLALLGADGLRPAP